MAPARLRNERRLDIEPGVADRDPLPLQEGPQVAEPAADIQDGSVRQVGDFGQDAFQRWA
jgi:hypothetical protein